MKKLIARTLLVIVCLIVPTTILSVYTKLYTEEYKVEKVTDARSKIVFESGSFEVDNPLLPHVKEFIQSAYKYNEEAQLVERLDDFSGIYFDKTSDNLSGLTYHQKAGEDFSVVNNEKGYSDDTLKVIVFHELFHAFYYSSHCHDVCDQIMSSTLNLRMIYNGDWEAQKENLFKTKTHIGVNFINKFIPD